MSRTIVDIVYPVIAIPEITSFSAGKKNGSTPPFVYMIIRHLQNSCVLNLVIVSKGNLSINESLFAVVWCQLRQKVDRER